MSKIYAKKIVRYYEKEKYQKTVLLEKKLFDTLEESLDYLKTTPINYIENKTGFSAYEEIYLLRKVKANHFMKYTKCFVNNEIEIIEPEEVD